MRIGDTVKIKKKTLTELYNNPEWLIDMDTIGALKGNPVATEDELKNIIEKYIATNGYGKVAYFNSDGDPRVDFKKVLNGRVYEYNHYFDKTKLIVIKKAFD